MKSDEQFYIDNKPYKFERSPEKVSTLLHMARTSADDAFLVSKDGIEHGNPDELIEIAPGDHFTTRKHNEIQKPVDKPIRYNVNGEQNTTLENPLSLKTILRNAGIKASIDINCLDSYYLENTVDGRKYEKPDDLVTLSDGDNFLAIHAGSTPVA